MKLTATERHNQRQLMRVISRALASKLRNLIRFTCELPPVDVDPRARFVTITLRDLHWVRAGAARSRAAKNRKRR